MKRKDIVVGVIITLIVVWLAFNVKPIGFQSYDIETLEELCQNEAEIFSGRLAQEYYDASRSLAASQSLNFLMEESNLRSEYAHKIREKYDVDPVLYSSILGGLGGSLVGC